MKIVPVLKLCTALLLATAMLLAACTVSVPATDTAPDAQANANTPAAMETIPPRPSITMITGGETLAGLAGAYCWLQAVNDIRCEPDPLNLEPAQAIQVAPGDALTFSLEGQLSIPGAFYAVLLDDADGGEPPRVDFGAVTSADYEVDLGPGVHRFDVVAEFPDISGDNSFVSYVFAVEIPESAVEAPTVAASPTRPPATATAAEAVTEEATEAATAVAAKPTESEPMATEEAIEAATEAVIASATAAPSSTPRPSPTVAATLPPPPTAAPTALPTATPQTVPEFGAALPSVVVVNGGQTYVPSGAQLCPPDAQDDSECVSQPASSESARLLVANGDTLRIDLEGNGPASLAVALDNNSLTAEINRLELPGNAIVLYTIDAPPGNYVLVVTAVWPDAGVATYFFRLQVQS